MTEPYMNGGVSWGANKSLRAKQHLVRIELRHVRLKLLLLLFVDGAAVGAELRFCYFALLCLEAVTMTLGVGVANCFFAP